MRLEPSFKEKILSDERVVFAGKLTEGTEEMFLVAVPLKKDNQIIGSIVIFSPLAGLKEHINSILAIALIGTNHR